MSFTKKTLTSATWALSSGYTNIIIGFIGNLLLARILKPEDFGVFSLASSLLVFVTMLTGFGSQEAIMQCRDESIEDLIPTAFWISLTIGMIVAVGGILTGLVIWPHYGRTIGLIIITLSVFVPLSSLANAHASVLRRNMEYKPVALTQTISSAVSFFVGVIAALLGMGPWALVFKQVLAEIIFWFGMKVSSNYSLRRVYNRKAARWIWSFGWKQMLIQINNTIFGRYDNLMIGTYIGNTQLGYYNQAYRLAWLGQQFTQGAIAPVLLPMFGAMQYSTEKLRYSLERVCFWICRAIPLFSALIFLSGDRIVIFVYGQKWATAGQYFQKMSIFFMFLPIAETLRYFLTGAGYISRVLKIGWVQLGFFVIGVTIGALLKNISVIIWVVNLNYVLATLLMGYAVSRIVPINWLYVCAAPALTLVLTIVLGQQIATWLPESFLGMLLFIFIIILLYIAFLALFEYRSLRREINIIFQASRRK